MSFFSSLEADLASWVSSIEGDLESAGKQEAGIVATAVAQAAPTLIEAEVTNLVSGTPSQAAAVASKLLTTTAASVEAASATVGINALMSGVQTTITSIQTAAKTAAPEPTPPAAA